MRLAVLAAKPDANLTPLQKKSGRIRRALERSRQEFSGYAVEVHVKAIVDSDGNVSPEADAVFEEITAAVTDHIELFDTATVRFDPNAVGEGERPRANLVEQALQLRTHVNLMGNSKTATEGSARTALLETYNRLNAGSQKP